jgi:hypothetical protein
MKCPAPFSMRSSLSGDCKISGIANMFHARQAHHGLRMLV